jgi:hypothetical protein
VQRLSDRRHQLHAERPIRIPEYLTIHDASEATMKYPNAEELVTLLQYKRLLAAGELKEATATADMLLASDTLLPSSIDQRICTNYSEEAIPERDPAYRLSDGTLDETQIVKHMPAAERLALARCLEQLGMSRAKAAVVANL